MSDVQCSLVLLPVSGKGVLAHVDGWGLLHGVDQEIADCGRVGGVRGGRNDGVSHPCLSPWQCQL